MKLPRLRLRNSSVKDSNEMKTVIFVLASLALFGSSIADFDTSFEISDTKINVHLIQHSHDDTGWLLTVDQYFVTKVHSILDTVVSELLKDKNRRFIYSEVAFFSRWFDLQVNLSYFF